MTFKLSVTWHKVTEKMPENDKSYLVWTGKEIVVSRAHVYNEEEKAKYRELAESEMFTGNSEQFKNSLKNAKGKFADFGVHWYFDNPKVYWAELPLAPGEENPPLPDPFEGLVSRDAYFTKDGNIIGIHAIGHEGPYEWTHIAIDGAETQKKSDFMQMEIWGNEYNDQFAMIGKGSFRIFNQFEEEVKEWEKEGWTKIERPKKDKQ